MQAALRFLEAERVDQGGLADVLAGVLARDRAVVAGAVQEIVLDLEGLASGQREGAQLPRDVLVGMTDDRRHVHGHAQQQAGLEFIGGGDGFGRARAAVQVFELAAHEALVANRLRQRRDQARARDGRDVLGLRQHAEGAAEQRDRGQDGDVFAELDMDRRFAAAQAGVVHAGQVVEDQGCGVHHLDRAGDIDQGRGGAAEVAGDQHHEQWTHALAGAQGRRAHGLGQAVGLAGTAQELFDACVDRRAQGVDIVEGGLIEFCQAEPVVAR